MEPRLWLAIPSAAVLLLLIAHSFRSLPRWRALLFWISVVFYGLLRNLGVEAITVRYLGSAMPYRLTADRLTLFGVPVQELAGWAIVSYLAWWMGWRFAGMRSKARGKGGHPFAMQIAFATLFLGAMSWSIEAAAIHAGWWHWTIPSHQPTLLAVPLIGIIDWALVATDFLFPFVALTSSTVTTRWKYLTLLCFPLHFGAHLLTRDVSAASPLAYFDLAHWFLAGFLLWLAIRFSTRDDSFTEESSFSRRAPLIGAAIVLLDVVVVDLLVASSPMLMLATIPAACLILVAYRPAWAPPLALSALVGALALPGLVWAGLGTSVAALLQLGRPPRRRLALVVALIVVAAALGFSARTQHSYGDIRQSMEQAVNAVNRGDTSAAERQLEELVAREPDAHAPLLLLGELYYREQHLGEAKRVYEKALAIKVDTPAAYRRLAIIAFKEGELGKGGEMATRGLHFSPNDLQLRYLQGHARGLAAMNFSGAVANSKEAGELSFLAFEVGDVSGAIDLLDDALQRWKGERTLYQSRFNVAVGAKDWKKARQVAEQWAENLPNDPDAKTLLLKLADAPK